VGCHSHSSSSSLRFILIDYPVGLPVRDHHSSLHWVSVIVPHSTGFPVVIPRFVGEPNPRTRTSFIALAIPILLAQSLAPRPRCSLLARWSSFSVLVARAFASVPSPRIGCHWPRFLFLICWNPFPVILLARSPFVGLGFPVPASPSSACIVFASPLVLAASPLIHPHQSSFVLAFLIRGPVHVRPRGPPGPRLLAYPVLGSGVVLGAVLCGLLVVVGDQRSINKRGHVRKNLT
jgi:hypothetical protein